MCVCVCTTVHMWLLWYKGKLSACKIISSLYKKQQVAHMRLFFNKIQNTYFIKCQL